MNAASILKKRSIDLHKLRVFLEKRLKRLRKSVCASTVVSTAATDAETTRPALKKTIKLSVRLPDNPDEPILVDRNTRVFAPIYSTYDHNIDNDREFVPKKNDLFDRCERQISELGRMCRNLSQHRMPTTTTGSRYLTREQQLQANPREHRRKELIRKLITTEAEERKLLVAIGLKGRELRRALLNDYSGGGGGGSGGTTTTTMTMTMTRIGSSGEMLAR